MGDKEEKEESLKNEEEKSNFTTMIRLIVREEIKEYFERSLRKDQL